MSDDGLAFGVDDPGSLPQANRHAHALASGELRRRIADGAWEKLLDAVGSRPSLLLPGEPLSPVTLRLYRSVFEYLERCWRESGDRPALIAANRGTQSTFKAYRSAYRFGVGESWLALEQEFLGRAPAAPDGAETRALVDRALEWADHLAEFELAPPALRKPTTPRHDLARLPPQWRETIARHCPRHIRLPYLVMAVTGCRPSELVAGVTVAVVDDRLGPLVHFSIPGAKVTALRGQPRRDQWWSLHGNELLCLLYDALCRVTERTDEGGALTVRLANRYCVSSVLKRLSPKLFGHSRLSSYSLRYQLASDMARAGFDETRIAQALGHSEVWTQRRYRPELAPAWNAHLEPSALVRVSAQRPVRPRLRSRGRARTVAQERILGASAAHERSPGGRQRVPSPDIEFARERQRTHDETLVRVR